MVAGLLLGLTFTPPRAQAQSDSVAAAVASAQGLLSVAPDERPSFGTYWDVRNSLPCLGVPLPFPPDDTNLAVYAIGDGHFLVDDMAESLVGPLPPAYANRSLGTEDQAAIVEAQADELTDFVTRLQAWLQDAPLNRGSALDTDPPPSPGGGGDGFTDPSVGMSFSGISHGTNQLWIELLAPFATNSTATLVIHPPWDWDSLTGTYDLLTCTNLTPPIAWQWLKRTDPGQTNLTVSVTDPQRFYRLSLPNDLLATSSLGTNFWIAFPSLANFLFGTNLFVYISSPLGATGVVTVPGLGITNAFTVDAGAVTNIALTSSVMMVEYDVIETNGIHITASQPVAVYGVDFSTDLSASFTGYPTTLLGTNYCLMARAAQDGWPSDPDSYSQFAIVATVNNTTVHIAPSPTADLYGHTNAYTKNLQQGQTYQIRSTDKTGDVTGTWITSDKPIGVFAGANIAWVPDINSAAANPLVQEQLAVETWGKQALTLSFAGRSKGDTYRVLAAYNNTVVFTNGVAAETNQAGQFLDMVLDGPVEFKASQPIQVAHFANGFHVDGTPSGGDPCEILLPPAGHYLRTNIVFSLPNNFRTGDFTTNYLSVIVPQSAISSTLVDGSTLAATNFVAIGTSGYSGARITVTNTLDINDVEQATAHTVISSQPVGVEFYGFTPYDAYGCFGGIVK